METLSKFIKTIRSGIPPAFLICLAFCGSILLALIAGRYHIRVDATREHTNSFSNKTRQTLRNLHGNPVHIISFYREDDPRRAVVEELLKDYALLDSKLKYEIIDPDQFPSIAKRYDVDRYGLTVIEAFGRQVRIGAAVTELPEKDSFLFDAVCRKAEEEILTRALSEIQLSEQKVIYFVSGHDEPNLSDRSARGYFRLVDELESRFYKSREVSLAKESVPLDASLLILAGPHTDLTKEELNRLYDYFEKGGKLILAIDPVLPGEGNRLQSFLFKLGIELGNDVVIDPAGQSAGGDFLVAFIERYAKHPAVSELKAASLSPLARSVRRRPKLPDQMKVTELAFTGSQSWAEKDLNALENGKFNYDEGVDPAGPISVAATIESLEGKGKMFVIGDSDMFNNEYFRAGGNASLMLGILDWLLGKPSPSERVLRKNSGFPLIPQGEASIFFVCVVFIPLFFIILGTILSLWRRRYE